MSICSGKGWQANYVEKAGTDQEYTYSSPVVFWVRDDESGDKFGCVIEDKMIVKADRFSNFKGYSELDEEPWVTDLFEEYDKDTLLTVELVTGRRFVGRRYTDGDSTSPFMVCFESEDKRTTTEVRPEAIASIETTWPLVEEEENKAPF